MNKETISVINSIVRPEKNLILDTKAKAHNNIKHFSKRSKATVLAAMAASFIFVFGFLLVQFGMENNANKELTNSSDVSLPNSSNYSEFDEIIPNIRMCDHANTPINVSIEEIPMKHLYCSALEMFNSDKIALIISGTVESVNTHIYKSLIYSEVVLQIQDTLKGSTTSNDTISFIELGGTIDKSASNIFFSQYINRIRYSLYINTCKDDFSKGFSIIYNMYTNSKVGDKIVVFLEETSLDFHNKETYLIAGSCQGKFIQFKEEYIPASLNCQLPKYRYKDFLCFSKN